MAYVSIKIMGQEGVTQMFRETNKRASDLRPVFRRPGITSDFRRLMVERFYSEGAFHGTPWMPLKESTIKLKVSLGYPVTILHRTGELRRSFTTGVMGWRVMTRQSIGFGTDLHYGYIHQGPEPWRHIARKSGNVTMVPARPPWEWDERTERKWTRAINRYIQTGVVSLAPW